MNHDRRVKRSLVELFLLVAGVLIWISDTSSFADGIFHKRALDLKISSEKIRRSGTDQTTYSPVIFVQNVGQWDERAAFQVWGGPSGTMWIAKDGSIWLTLVERPHSSQTQHPFPFDLQSETFNRSSSEQHMRGVNLKLTFIGANPTPRLEPFDRLGTVVSYFIGANESQWHPDVPVWGGVRLVDLYPGVDLEISSEPIDVSKKRNHSVRSRSVGNTWRLVCRVDCAHILENMRMRIDGATKLELVSNTRIKDGNYIHAYANTYSAYIPLLDIKSARNTQLHGQFTTHIEGYEVLHPFGSNVGNTPKISQSTGKLIWSTFIGGSAGDLVIDAMSDSQGNLYAAGWTYSLDFPHSYGTVESTYSQDADILVIKISSDGKRLLYAAFVGGSQDDTARSISVNNSGYAYITGWTTSFDFPRIRSFDHTYGGNGDAFLVKLNDDGRSLVYSTFIGGSARDGGYGIAVDNRDRPYVTGYTYSHDFYATPNAFDSTYNGGRDAFVMKMDESGRVLLYSTFIGGKDEVALGE